MKNLKMFFALIVLLTINFGLRGERLPMHPEINTCYDTPENGTRPKPIGYGNTCSSGGDGCATNACAL